MKITYSFHPVKYLTDFGFWGVDREEVEQAVLFGQTWNPSVVTRGVLTIEVAGANAFEHKRDLHAGDLEAVKSGGAPLPVPERVRRPSPDTSHKTCSGAPH